MKTLYLDCFSGISGDMTLGAFIDLGIDADYLTSELKKLNLGGYTIEVSKKAKNGIMGTDVDVILHEEEEHDHEHEGHHHEHEHDHEGHHHKHEHGHSHEGHEHSH
ncbi:MAG: nickel insertion protein, partial [Cellulosilyticaceae bacterium]